MRNLLMVACMLGLVGCASTSVFKVPQKPGDGKALVYVIRDHFPPHKREAQLYVNGEQLATMADDDIVAVNVPVGANKVLVTINGDKPFSFDLQIAREETTYISLSGDVKWLSGRAYVKGPSEVFEIDLSRNVRAVQISRDEALSIASRIHRDLD